MSLQLSSTKVTPIEPFKFQCECFHALDSVNANKKQKGVWNIHVSSNSFFTSKTPSSSQILLICQPSCDLNFMLVKMKLNIFLCK